MGAVGLTTWQWENEMKTIFLIFLIPGFLFAMVWGIIYFTFWIDREPLEEGARSLVQMTNELFLLLLLVGVPLLLIWFFCSLAFHRSIVFSVAQARPITRKQSPELYNIIENLCISRGMSMPRVGIIDDAGCNAFATGWRQKDSWIVFTRGLLETLNKKEVQAVAAHELTHIRNKDVKMVTILFVFMGILSTLGYILLRSLHFSGGSRRSGRGGGKQGLILLLLGLGLYLFSLTVFPLIRLAISRKREFLADAGAVELTKDREAMMSALQKISGGSAVKSLKDPMLSAFCIASAKGKKTSSFFSSHPSLEERLTALRLI